MGNLAESGGFRPLKFIKYCNPLIKDYYEIEYIWEYGYSICKSQQYDYDLNLINVGESDMLKKIKFKGGFFNEESEMELFSNKGK